MFILTASSTYVCRKSPQLTYITCSDDNMAIPFAANAKASRKRWWVEEKGKLTVC